LRAQKRISTYRQIATRSYNDRGNSFKLSRPQQMLSPIVDTLLERFLRLSRYRGSRHRGTMHNDIEWFRTQLTMARWNLDSAIAASRQEAGGFLAQARQTYERIREALPHSQLHQDQHRQIEDALEELCLRLRDVQG
jgi:hypothetical protein